jgi:hypothetical protein
MTCSSVWLLISAAKPIGRWHADTYHPYRHHDPHRTPLTKQVTIPTDKLDLEAPRGMIMINPRFAELGNSNAASEPDLHRHTYRGTHFARKAHLTSGPCPLRLFHLPYDTMCPHNVSLLTTLRAPSRLNGVILVGQNIVRRLPHSSFTRLYSSTIFCVLFSGSINQPWCVARNKHLPFPHLPHLPVFY